MLALRNIVEITTKIQVLVAQQKKHPTSLEAYRETMRKIDLLIIDYGVVFSELAGHYAISEILHLPMEKTETVEWDKRGGKVLSTHDIITLEKLINIIGERQAGDLATAIPAKFVELVTVKRDTSVPPQAVISMGMLMESKAPGRDFEERLIQAFVDLLKEIEETLNLGESPRLGTIKVQYKFQLPDEEQREVGEQILRKVGSDMQDFPRLKDLLALQDEVAYQESFYEQGLDPPGDAPDETPHIMTVADDTGDRAVAAVSKSAALVRTGKREVTRVLRDASPVYRSFILARAERIRTEPTFDYDMAINRRLYANATAEHAGIHLAFLVKQFIRATHPATACDLLGTIIECTGQGADNLHMLKSFFADCDDDETCEVVWMVLQNIYPAVLTNELLPEIARYAASERVVQEAVTACGARGLDVTSILQRRAKSLEAHKDVQRREAQERGWQKTRDLAAELADGYHDNVFIDNTVARIRACANSDEEADKTLLGVLLRTRSFPVAYHLWETHIIETHLTMEELNRVSYRFSSNSHINRGDRLPIEGIASEAWAEIRRREQEDQLALEKKRRKRK